MKMSFGSKSVCVVLFSMVATVGVGAGCSAEVEPTGRVADNLSQSVAADADDAQQVWSVDAFVDALHQAALRRAAPRVPLSPTPPESEAERLLLSVTSRMDARHLETMKAVMAEMADRGIDSTNVEARGGEVASASTAEARAFVDALVKGSAGRISARTGRVGTRAFPIVIPVITFIAGYLAEKAIDKAIASIEDECERVEAQTDRNCDIIESQCRASGQNPFRQDIGVGTGCNFYCFVYCGGRRYAGRLNRWFEGESQIPSTAPY